ncbi:MAG: META domain-containing protein [Candidatus Paceibacterota bacterium]
MNKKITIASVIIIVIAAAAFLLTRPKDARVGSGAPVFVSAVFYSSSGQRVNAVFSEGKVDLGGSFGSITLKQVISASGARYANDDESFVFWNKGNDVTIYQNGKVIFQGFVIKPGNLISATPTVLVISSPSAGSIPKGKLPAGSIPAGDFKTAEGITWLWRETVMKDGSIITPKKPDTFSMTLLNGKLAGRTDCNGFSGQYQVGSDGYISIDRLMSTEMYCQDSQESIFTGEIAKVNNYRLDGRDNLELILSGNTGTMRFWQPLK